MIDITRGLSPLFLTLSSLFLQIIILAKIDS
jgi:hypothetical protein